MADKLVDSKQLTVVWHLNDLKVSHLDKHAVNHFISQMSKEFGKERDLNISRGKIHIIWVCNWITLRQAKLLVVCPNMKTPFSMMHQHRVAPMI